MTNDEKALVLEIAKANLNLSSTIRDSYLTQLRNSAEAELNRKGVSITTETKSDFRLEYVTLLADLVAWRYRNRGGESDFPRHLSYRLHCLMFGD